MFLRKMKKLNLILGFLFLVLASFVSCSKTCDCTYYDEEGNVVSSYSRTYEDLGVSDCSKMDTYGQDDIEKGYKCK